MFFQVFTSIFHYTVPWNHPSTVAQECASSISAASNLIKFCYFCNFSTVSQISFTALHLALIAFRLNSFGNFPLVLHMQHEGLVAHLPSTTLDPFNFGIQKMAGLAVEVETDQPNREAATAVRCVIMLFLHLS